VLVVANLIGVGIYLFAGKKAGAAPMQGRV
jgi:hypothetical protein